MVQYDESVEEESYQEESIEKKDSKKNREFNELKKLLKLLQDLMEQANKLDIVKRNSQKQYKFNFLILFFFVGVFILGFVFDLIFNSENKSDISELLK